MKCSHTILRNTFIYLLLAVFCLMMFPAAAEEEKILESGEFRYRVLEDETAEIVEYTGKGYNVTIPDTLDGLTVTSIGKEAFYHKVFQKTLTIPDTLKHIGDGAFGLCDIENVTIPETVISMDGNPFGFCENLEGITLSGSNPEFYLQDGVLFSRTDKALVYYPIPAEKEEYTIPEGTERISKWAFGGSEWLTAVYIPETVTYIGEMAFAWCEGLQEMIVPDSVTEIEAAAFMDCESLKSAVLPAGLTVISEQLFYECGSLLNVVIPDSVTEIEESAFDYCCSLEEISIPEGVARIGNGAFEACESLKAVTLPDGITEIPDWAFNGCFQMEKINIPDGVTHIGETAFRYCNNLKTLIIPDSVTEIGESAFEECSEELVITGGIDSAAQKYCEKNNIQFRIIGEGET